MQFGHEWPEYAEPRKYPILLFLVELAELPLLLIVISGSDYNNDDHGYQNRASLDPTSCWILEQNDTNVRCACTRTRSVKWSPYLDDSEDERDCSSDTAAHSALHDALSTCKSHKLVEYQSITRVGSFSASTTSSMKVLLGGLGKVFLPKLQHERVDEIGSTAQSEIVRTSPGGPKSCPPLPLEDHPCRTIVASQQSS
jgi:hypothetical protein